MGWFFDQVILENFQNAAPWLEWPFKIITYFGDAIIYIILLAIAYWIFNKREAIIGIYVLLTTSFLNFFLKVIIANPRPNQSIRLVEESGFSTPSGHAQLSSSMYGWIMLYFKKIWLYITVPILVILICISRVFLGVHYIGDVILGFIIGSTLLISLFFGIPPLLKWMEKWPFWVKIVAGEAYAIIAFLITFLLGFYANWPPGDETNSAYIVAALLLLPIFILVDKKWINMKNENLHWSSKLLRVIVGLILTIGFYFGFDVSFDFIIEIYTITGYGLLYLFSFLKYSIVFAVVGLLLPYLFANVKIFSKFNEVTATTEISESATIP